MARVHHRVGIKGTPEAIFAAISEADKLTGWWASSANGVAELDARLTLGFENLTHLIFKVDQIEPDRLLSLSCEGEPEIWIGSTLVFELEASEHQIYLRLTHEKAGVDDEAFLYFNTKWPHFLVSLKDYIETGMGRPFPGDVRIDHDS